MLVPAVVVRLTRPPTPRVVGRLHDRRAGRVGLHRGRDARPGWRRSSRRGWWPAAARSRSLIVEAGIRGIAVPVTAAAVGGLIGAALWFTRPPSKADQHPGYVRAVLAVVRRGGDGRLRRAGTRRRRRTSRSGCSWSSIYGVQWWRFCCCGSGCISRCCTRRTTRSTPTSRCCVRTVTTSCPTWRSARRAGWPPAPRRGHRERSGAETRPTSRAPDEPTTDADASRAIR